VRPGPIARALLLLLLGGAVGWFAHLIYATTSPKPTVYIFDDKRYMEFGGETVYAAGSRTGQGVTYPDNTMAIACFHDRMECWMASIEGISTNSCQIGRMESPSFLQITKWDDYELVASDADSTVACTKLTISINRKLQTVLFVDEPINIKSSFCSGTRTDIQKSTLENSRWQSVMFPKK
jgi:hypothetical protein